MSGSETPSRSESESSGPTKPALLRAGLSSTIETLEYEAIRKTHSLPGNSKVRKNSNSMDSPEPNKPAVTQPKISGELLVPDVVVISEPCPDRKRRNGKLHTVLIIAMAKKANSKPMKAILARLSTFKELDVCVLAEDMFMNNDSTLWPRCDCLIAFGHGKYPIDKVETYANRVEPLLINDLASQRFLFDRREILRILESSDIPTPPHIVVIADNDRKALSGEYTWSQLEERDDAIAVKGGEILMQRPFVEKPVAATDHNIVIYFANGDGGGSQHLFRKTGNRCSEYHAGYQPVRKDGSMIYETFIPTGGTDIKVYTVTGAYAHAEGRKAPVIDGKVLRDGEGKEMRCPIMLNKTEKEFAQEIVQAFKQNICGFDILRTNKVSYVCDVNGWSFVKRSEGYMKDCSNILRGLINRYCAGRSTSYQTLTSWQPTEVVEAVKVGAANVALRDESPAPSTYGAELLCVIAVMRHADRTPKQKMKSSTTATPWCHLYLKYAKGPKLKEVKLKSRSELLGVLKTAEAIVEGDFVETDKATANQIIAVITRYPLQGINRKFQIKPVTITIVDGKQVATKLQLIMKWGGELTSEGENMARAEGERFRKQLYIDETSGGGLLRLHNTFRHDLKIYSSDEGRVQETAAAFAQGLLDLEGDLPPILASLVRKDEGVNKILDDSSLAKEKLEQVKGVLHDYIRKKDWKNAVEVHDTLNPRRCEGITEALNTLDADPRAAMYKLREAGTILVQGLTTLMDAQTEPLTLYDGEMLEQMYVRWQKVLEDFYSAKSDEFNVSKILDIYDCVRYDGRHNQMDALKDAYQEVYHYSRSLFAIICSEEYGMTMIDKFEIASKMSMPLRAKLLDDLRVAARRISSNPVEGGESESHRFNPKGAGFVRVKSPSRNVRSRFYFTSESHMYALLDMLRSGFYDEKVQTVKCLPSINLIELDQNLRFLSPKVLSREQSQISLASPLQHSCRSLQDALRRNDRVHKQRQTNTKEFDQQTKCWEDAMEFLHDKSELNCLSQIVCRLFERKDVPPDSPHRYFVEWLMSTGQRDVPPSEEPAQPCVEPLIRLHCGMPLDEVEAFLKHSYMVESEFDEYEDVMSPMPTSAPRVPFQEEKQKQISKPGPLQYNEETKIKDRSSNKDVTVPTNSDCSTSTTATTTTT